MRFNQSAQDRESGLTRVIEKANADVGMCLDLCFMSGKTGIERENDLVLLGQVLSVGVMNVANHLADMEPIDEAKPRVVLNDRQVGQVASFLSTCALQVKILREAYEKAGLSESLDSLNENFIQDTDQIIDTLTPSLLNMEDGAAVTAVMAAIPVEKHPSLTAAIQHYSPQGLEDALNGLGKPKNNALN